MEGLFYLFALTIIISGVMVISALNPVHFVVVTFIDASALFILLEIYFFSFNFINCLCWCYCNFIFICNNDVENNWLRGKRSDQLFAHWDYS